MDDHKLSDCSNCKNKGKYIYTSNFTGKRVISSVRNRHPLGGGQKPCDELMMQFRNKHGLQDCTEVVCNDYSPKPGLPMPKPPMGVKPRFIVADERLNELREGTRRYLDAYKQVPVEWIDEYNELVAYLDSRKEGK